MKKTHDILAGGTPARLAAKRAYIAKRLTDKNQDKKWEDFSPLKVTWTGKVRHSQYLARSRAISGDYAGAVNCESWPMDHVGAASDIVARLPLGWYCDGMEWETVRGEVLRFRAKQSDGKKALVYIPAVSWSDSDGLTFWPCEQYDTAEDAARAADSTAESIARGSREYFETEQEMERAEEALAEARETIRRARASFASIAADYKRSQMAGAVCVLVQDELARLRAQVRETAGRLTDLTETKEAAAAALARLDRRIAANYPQDAHYG